MTLTAGSCQSVPYEAPLPVGSSFSNAPLSQREPTLVGQTAPAIRGMDLAGQPFDSDQVTGKVIVLCFWGDWCPPCRSAHEFGRTLTKKYPPLTFEFIGINGDRDPEIARRTVARQAMTWRQVQDHDSKIGQQFGIQSWPMYLVLNPDGLVLCQDSRPSEISQAVDEALRDLSATD